MRHSSLRIINSLNVFAGRRAATKSVRDQAGVGGSGEGMSQERRSCLLGRFKMLNHSQNGILGFWERKWGGGAEGPVSDIKAPILIQRTTVGNFLCSVSAKDRNYAGTQGIIVIWSFDESVGAPCLQTCVRLSSCLPSVQHQLLCKPPEYNICKAAWACCLLMLTEWACLVMLATHPSSNLMIAYLSCDVTPNPKACPSSLSAKSDSLYRQV